MKTSYIRIHANVLKGIMKFGSRESVEHSKYDFAGVGFRVDKRRDQPLARYQASNGGIGITGTCGLVKGDPLPKKGVLLPFHIYPKGIESEDELTLVIDHRGFVNTLNKSGNNELRTVFDTKAKPAPMLKAIPIGAGGTLKVGPEKIPDILLSCELSKKVMTGLSHILGSSHTFAIHYQFFGKKGPVIFTCPDSGFDFVAAQMPIA